MLSRRLRKTFSSGSSGLGKMFKSWVSAPKRVLGIFAEPSAKKQEIFENTTAEAFDGVSQEWQSLVVGNAFDVQTFSHYEQLAQNNFGTVDNPHVIFTADAPFRYVGCSGQPNPDDYEGHEFMMFMLREGPLQRCPVCGQVYKLVRLRDEMSQENDYYLSGLLPYEHQEFGEADHWQHMSVLRMMPDSYEHTNFSVESARSYSLINPDDHDRMLVDPAYRMEKLTEGERVHSIMNQSLKEISDQLEAQGVTTTSRVMNKDTYEALIDAEIAIRRFDRHFKNLKKFHARHYLDLDNHERRESRKQLRADARQVDSYTVFYGGLSEEELQYKDYFETEIEETGENEAYERVLDEEIIRSDPFNKAELYDFSVHYTDVANQDAQSILKTILFNFRNRRQIDSPADFERRQERLVSRQVKRATTGEFNEVEKSVALALESGTKSQKVEAEGEYFDLIMNDSLIQFADYYETEGEQNLDIIQSADLQDLSELILSFKDYTKLGTDSRGYYSIPKRKWNNGMGLTGNLVEEFKDLTGYVLPKLDHLSNVSQAKMLTSRDEKYMVEATKTAEVAEDNVDKLEE